MTLAGGLYSFKEIGKEGLKTNDQKYFLIRTERLERLASDISLAVFPALLCETNQFNRFLIGKGRFDLNGLQMSFLIQL